MFPSADSLIRSCDPSGWERLPPAVHSPFNLFTRMSHRCGVCETTWRKNRQIYCPLFFCRPRAITFALCSFVLSGQEKEEGKKSCPRRGYTREEWESVLGLLPHRNGFGSVNRTGSCWSLKWNEKVPALTLLTFASKAPIFHENFDRNCSIKFETHLPINRGVGPPQKMEKK